MAVLLVCTKKANAFALLFLHLLLTTGESAIASYTALAMDIQEENFNTFKTRRHSVLAS